MFISERCHQDKLVIFALHLEDAIYYVDSKHLFSTLHYKWQGFGAGLYKSSRISNSVLQANKCRTANTWSLCASVRQHWAGDWAFLLPSKCCFVRTAEPTLISHLTGSLTPSTKTDTQHETSLTWETVPLDCTFGSSECSFWERG